MPEKNISNKARRPQDVWNERHGLVSKSYKLYKSVTEDFADSCSRNGVSQAGQLTELITSYTTTTNRRTYTMYIQGKYSQNYDIQRILQQKLDGAVSRISDDDISQFLDHYRAAKIQGQRFSSLHDPLEYSHNFWTPSEIEAYVNAGAPEIIDYAVNVLMTQIALSMLVADKKLMPTSLRQNYRIELDVNHNRGNSLFYLFVDVLPYESYLIINDK